MDVSPDQHWFGIEGATNINSANPTGTGGNRGIFPPSSAMSRAAMNRVGVGLGLPVLRAPGACVPAHGGYGGGWVPLVALKKVLCGILKYLGVLWVFAQLPDLLREILGSILKENEDVLLNLDQEQPALRFFVGGYVFAVSVHRVQLLLQVLSVRRFLHQQQQQQPQNGSSAAAQEDLTQSDYFRALRCFRSCFVHNTHSLEKKDYRNYNKLER